jgi:hypothetical protein
LDPKKEMKESSDSQMTLRDKCNPNTLTNYSMTMSLMQDLKRSTCSK